MFYRKVLSIVVAIVAMLALTHQVQAGVSTAGESVTVDRKAGDATFNINFGHAPDFFTADAHGRLADSFQVQISNDPIHGNADSAPTTVIRGDEIQFLHAIPVRNATPSSTDPHSGGFGTIRGTVPFSVNGSDLSFTTPLSLIDAPDGKFKYDVFVTQNGATVAQVEGRSVPLPPALQAGLMMLGIGMVFGIGRSVKRSRLLRKA